jgi:gliding motility-associated-like protein
MKNILLILFLLVAGVFATKSSAQAVILKADTLEVPCASTDTFLIPVRLDNFTDVSGLQFTLQWDVATLDYAYVTMLHPQFVGVGFDTSAATLALGKLTFAWTDLAGVSVPPNTVLFQVAFRRIGGPQTPISFVNDPTAIAVFDNQFNELLNQVQPGAVKPIDDIGPTLTCPANVTVTAPGATAVPNIPPVLADNCGTPAAGWSAVGATVASFPNDPDASGALFNLGTSTVTYTTTDAGGNTATCAFEVLVEFAVSSTDLTLIASPNNAASCGDSVTIDVLAFNFDSIAGLQFSMEWLQTALGFVSITNPNAGINIALSNFNTDSTGVGLLSFAWTSANLTGNTVPDGEVLFSLTYSVLGSGTLAFGNNPTAALAFTGTIFPPEEVPFVTVNATISVTDTLPPSIGCPADVTVQAPGAASVQGIAPMSVTDNCAAPLVGWAVTGATTGSSPNDSDASGALFNVGTSTVTYTATDAGGNTGTCSFNVTVEFVAPTDLTIIANSANAACGGSFSVDITSLNFVTVAGVQFTINWDASLYQYTSVSNFNLPAGIGVSNFGVDSVGVGFITFAWTSGDLNGTTVANGELLFSLNFDLLTNTSSTITFGDDPTIRVAFDGGSFLEIPMLTVDGQVSVLDNVPPTITCPNPAPVDAPQGQLFAPVSGLEPLTLTDNCAGIPGLTYTQTGATANSGTGNANGDYNAGTTTVVYTATDGNGNTATCSFQVVVNAGTPVVLQLDTVDLGCSGVPSQITVNLTVENFVDIIGLQFGLDWDPLVLELVTPVPIQYITAGPPPIFVNQTNGSLAFFGGHPGWPDVPDDSTIVTLTFNVLDVNGLATTLLEFIGPYDALDANFQSIPVQTINGAFVFTLDNVPPTVTCPTDTVLNAAPAGCTATFLPLAPTATDDCGSVANITISPDTTLFSAGTPTILTYTVSDDAGNTSTCTITVTVLDDTAPVLSACPVGPILADADSNCQAVVMWTNPTFLDACDANPIVTFDYLSGSLFSLGTTLVNITATDASLNATTCSFEVLVRDMTPPTIICPPDTVIVPIDGCSATVNFNAPVVADNCDADLNIICSDTSGTVFSGITTVTCVVVDDDSNVAQCDFTITVADALPPVFPNGCPPSDTVASASGNCGANPTWQAPLATDNCDQSLSIVSVPLSGGFLAAMPTPHTITYTATDDLGNTSTCTFTILVQDVTAPVLTNCPTLPVFIVLPVNKCDTLLTWTPPTVNDNCGLGGVLLIPNIPSGSVFTTGDTMVIYTATDASGNSSTCSFNVSIRDVVPPSFGANCPTTPFVDNNGSPCGVVVDWTFPLATDNCTPDSLLDYSSTYDTTSTFFPGTTTFPVRVTDASGNFVECIVTVTVTGQTPGFTNVPGDITVTMCDVQVSWIPPTAVGFCPPVTVLQTPLPPGSVFPFGTTTVTYTATDTLGNSAMATFNVIVSENVAPVIDCPVSPIVVNVAGGIITDPSDFLLSATTNPGCDAVVLTFNLPNATDDCVTPTVTQLQGLPSGDPFPIGFNDLIFRAVDSSGNLSQCAVFIEVTALPALDAVVNPVPGCQGDTVVITAANIPGATYTWVPGNSATNVLTILSLSSQNDGQYIVSASINGCVTAPDTVEVFMTVAPMAENDLTFSIDPGETITFPSVLDNDLLSPAFDFAICDTSVLPGLNMNFNDGTFTYTAGDEPGMVSFIYNVCSRTCPLEDQAAVTITINDTKCVFIPNIITPNGDDTNDWFTIPCIETGLFRENSLVVYNQWGDLVYEAAPYSNAPAEAWRGTLNGEAGKDLPDGVYFYIFKPGPNIAPMKGFVEIFR